MKANLADWLKLGAMILVVVAGAGIFALIINLTGDCGHGVKQCGETARTLSFVVLGLGVACALFLIARFVRLHRR